jgi:TfoX/Sxy family transcriptional regulator of competence genes
VPYNQLLASRIQNIISRWKEAEMKKMFGGICFIFKGHMVAGVYKDSLILRIGEQEANNALKLPHVTPFDITGKPMKGWIMIEEIAFSSDSELIKWINMAKSFVLTLPSK